MKRRSFCYAFVIVPFLAGTILSADWKAGVAKVAITPHENIWLAGYGNRIRPSDNIIHDLWAKALALEDSSGNCSVLVTFDLLGLTKPIYDRICERLETDLGLTKDRIILNASHNHSGPVLTGALAPIYPIDVDHDEVINRYTTELESKIVQLVSDAFQTMSPAVLYAENGMARFQVNRRRPRDGDQILVQRDELKGPNDFAVPVIKVTDPQGNIRAIVFGYACHPTIMDGYAIYGEYPGFAQIELEEKYPGAVAMFFQGAGGDQFAIPRRSIPWAKQYGQTLAVAVERVLQEQMRELSPVLLMAYSEVDLPLTTPPTKEELTKITERSPTQFDYERRNAIRMLEQMEKGQALIKSCPYPLQVWNIGGQPLMSLGGELVVEYSLGLKHFFGTDIFVMGYSNYVPNYIPSVAILKEGGYEADGHIVYGLPSRWSEEIEPLIYQEIKKLAASVDIKEQ